MLEDLRTGCDLEGDNQSNPTIPPDWLDKEKFNRGREFFKKHFVSMLLAMYTSLAAGLGVSNLLDPLVFTSRSNTPQKAFKRYLSTFKNVVRWHLGDVWDPNDPAFHSVQHVRRLHRQVAESMLSCGTMAVSQYDMALVQCGFMGAIVLYPREYGIVCSDEDLEDYVHFWRGIGHLLGMEDRYNICRGDLLETLQICSEIETIVRNSLENPPTNFKPMACAFIDGSNTPLRCRLFTYDSVITWICYIWSKHNKSKNLGQPSAGDLCRVGLYMAFCWVLRSCPCFERKLNSWFISNWYQYLKIEQPISC